MTNKITFSQERTSVIIFLNNPPDFIATLLLLFRRLNDLLRTYQFMPHFTIIVVDNLPKEKRNYLDGFIFLPL